MPLLQIKYWFSAVSQWLIPGFLRKKQDSIELRRSQTYSEWVAKATAIDHRNGAAAWKMRYEAAEYDYELVHERLQELRDCRKLDDWAKSAYLVRSTLDRNLGLMGSAELFQKCHIGTKVGGQHDRIGSVLQACP